MDQKYVQRACTFHSSHFAILAIMQRFPCYFPLHFQRQLLTCFTDCIFMLDGRKFNAKRKAYGMRLRPKNSRQAGSNERLDTLR